MTTSSKQVLLRCVVALALLVALPLSGVTPAQAEASVFYVDSVAGSDGAAGTSPDAAWQSLAKVDATTFAPGDSILFKAGSAWSGKLAPKGSGSSAAPIRIGQYGTGGKPRIDGGGDVQGAVYLLNQPYWEIRDLEVTNHRSDSTRGQFVGIKVQNSTGGPLGGVYIGGNTIHDVQGLQSGYYGTNGGIAVVADMNGSRWDQVMVEHNEISAVDRIGIFVGPTWQTGDAAHWQAQAHTTNVTIQDNTIQDSGGDAILNFITANVVVQRNVAGNLGSRVHVGDSASTGYQNVASAGIWSAVSDNTLIQYNEVYNDTSVNDGQGFDIDLGSHSTYLQYNYSHNNRGGMVLLCEIADQGVDINDARVRFNISQNDGSGVITLCADYPKGPDKPDIMNNTIYLGPGSTASVIRRYSGDTAYGQAFIYNNIFYTLGSNPYLKLPATVFDYNTFYGNHHPTEPVGGHRLTSDPGLAQPGSAYIGLGSANGYEAVAGSPSIGSGTNTGMLGPSDYWGNPIGTPSRGADNGPGVPAQTPNFAFNATVTSSSSVECCAFFRPKVVDGSRNSIPTESGGFSSALGSTSQHEEWMALKFARQQTFSRVVLYPRNDPGTVGRGFPQHFHIQVWDGSQWLTRKTVSDTGSPSGPQYYSWGFSDWTDQIRIVTATTNGAPDGLQHTSEGYILQLAEIEVLP